MINDCSDEETTNYLSSFAAQHSEFKLINNEKNLGFVKSCNKGMYAATGDIVVLLNSDTKIPSEFCERIIKCFETDSKIGVASPISSHSWLYYIPLPKNLTLEQMNERLRKRHKCSYPLIHAAEGFCFCIRKKVIEQQGYLDEIYGKGYHEEVDFAYRAITNGWKNVLIDDLYVYHKRHASFGIKEREKLIKKNDKVYLERWSGFKEKYEKEHDLLNPVDKIKSELFPLKNFVQSIFSIKNFYGKKHKVIRFIGLKISIPCKPKKKLVVHFHLHYHEQIDFFVKKLKNINNCEYDLFVTYNEDNHTSKNKLLKINPNTHFIKVSNAGYDILPFYKVLKLIDLKDYDYILKIHTKGFRKINCIFGKGYLWRNSLVNSILGSRKTFSKCLKIFDEKKEIGMIGAKKNIIDMNLRNMPEDTFLYDEICQKFNLPNKKGFFIAGTMFLCRANLMDWFKNLELKEEEFSSKEECSGMNGKPIHVLERLLSSMIIAQENYICGINNKLIFSDYKEYKSQEYSVNFSIIMATYNRAFCIEKAINSLLNQTYPNFELIIIDDGSTDNTEQLIKERYIKEIEKKKIIYKKLANNQGVCKARNMGLKLAKNDWIGYLDSDNEMSPVFLSEFKNAIFNNKTKRVFYSQFLKNNKKVIGKEFNYKELIRSNFIDLGVFVHHKSLIKKYGSFDIRLKRLVDWDLILRYTKKEKIIFIKKVLLNYYDDNSFARITNTESLEKAKRQIRCKYESSMAKVFSIKNEKNHKVISIIGLKIKLKSQKLIEREKFNNLESKLTVFSALKNITPQPELKSIAVHLVDHCNLRCRGCDHFSPLAGERFESVEVFERDIKRFAVLSDSNLGTLKLMGGEPLLHPQLIDFMRISRSCLPETRIEIVTNAILLNLQKESFWNACKEYNIVIVPTKYPLKIDYEKAEKTAQSYGVKLEYYGNTSKVLKTSYHIPLDIDGKQDSVNNFLNCFHANNCVFLKQGKLYTCTVAPNICHFNKYFGIDIPLSDRDGIDIHKARNIDEVLSFLAKPIPFCKYCNVNGRTFGHDWGISQKEIEEWT